jgi:NAD(P)-dependent dehydrogenase (short-subunit alcohol dehydrogenase family)
LVPPSRREACGTRAISFNGRVALITGGSRGLGLLIAHELGQLGARVILAARDEAELQRAQEDLRCHDIDSSIVVADIGSQSEAERMVSQAVARFGRLDILVNNAGIIKVGPIDHMTAADFDEAMAIHFWGPFHTMRAALPHMRAWEKDASSTSRRLAARSVYRTWRRIAPASSR